jgi:hypothetical protein
MGDIRLVYVLFGISPMIWNGLRTYTEVPLYLFRIPPDIYTELLRHRVLRLSSDTDMFLRNLHHVPSTFTSYFPDIYENFLLLLPSGLA